MKKITKITTAVLATLVIILLCASFYFINYALSPSHSTPYDEEHEYSVMCEEYPELAPWFNTIRHTFRDTTIIGGDGRKLYARYAAADSASAYTAVIIHGYKMNSLSMLHLAYLYHHDMHYNILMPDLQCHGHSEGDEIQMGWKDKDDVKLWIDVANTLFTPDTKILVTGISMGGATTMMVSGEQLPNNVTCFIEDCGFTSVWDEFKGELKNQFGLPAFPLLNCTSMINKMWHGWDFKQASAINQVKKCRLPMLFIHGDNDTYVPTQMVYELYDAKTGPKEIYITKGSAHANSYADHPQEYTARVKQFLDKYMH
ncbi:MAG: alpha/beta hydrolase [Muribaculaceae bacterium]